MSNEEHVQVGWPRPTSHRYPEADHPENMLLPVPWISSQAVLTFQWSAFDSERIQQTVDHDLCNICGQALSSNRILIAVSPGVPVEVRREVYALETGGSAMHARCALLSFRACPHFRRWQHPVLRDKMFYRCQQGLGLTSLDGFVDGGRMFIDPSAKNLSFQQVKVLAIAENKHCRMVASSR